jgi:hypothetical protein
MDALSALFDQLKKSGQLQGNFLGFLQAMIGRKITRRADGVIVTQGVTWRELSVCLKKVRWDPEAVREIGVDPDTLPPRDRQRYWYTAISQAKVDSTAAKQAGDRFADLLRSLGYDVA